MGLTKGDNVGESANVCTVAGFDTSLAAWGWAVITARQVRVASGLLSTTWELQGCDVVTSKPLDRAVGWASGQSARVRGVYQRVSGMLGYFNLDALAVESLVLPVGRTSAKVLSGLAQVRGTVDALAVEQGLRLHDVAPREVKARAMGADIKRRRVEKDEVIDATDRAFGWGLRERFGSRAEHACDAVWVAIIGTEREFDR